MVETKATTPSTSAAATPMMRQYMSAKDAHPEALLLFRMGDFYELFFEDAVEAARVLELTLTSRNKKDADPIPMAGVPHHALDAYLPRLIAAGYKVAICEQVEDPKDAKGIVRREVVRVVTPGVCLEESALDQRAPNYLAALWRDDHQGPIGLAWIDVSTGERKGASVPDVATLLGEIARIEPREILIAVGDDALAEACAHSVDGLAATRVAPPAATGDGPLARAAAMLSGYVGEATRDAELHLRDLEVVELERTIRLGPSTVRNLELVRTLMDRERKGSLLWLLDDTRTAMGSRLLRAWILYPPADLPRVRRRQDAVQALADDPVARDGVRAALDQVYDMERLASRVAAATASPRDLLALGGSLARVPEIADTLRETEAPALAALADRLDPVAEAGALIARAIAPEAPPTLKDGGVIREGFDPTLDELLTIARDGKRWFAEYAAQLREQTGIGSLKIKFNGVFGYFIEVTKANLHLVPDDWHRKQTLASAERYLTLDLKEREEKVLGAEDRRLMLETRLYDQVRAEVARFSARLSATAAALAEADVLASLAETARRRGYVRPEVVEAPVIDIVAGRHPVIEALMPAGEFVPNDVRLDADDVRLTIITGPNMAGKSTVMRQTALIALMAHLGGFVPAERATVGLVDAIFTRVGATDNLARGQSTFMVEMTEAAEILAHATRHSLIILDEIGRGTSTFDGVSIAWAVAEHLHDHVGARTLFATHYHELTSLADTRPGVHNSSIAVREWRDEIVFLRQLVPGGTSRSYGIQVGRLAGLPASVVARATEVLENLEAQALAADSRPRLARAKDHRAQPDSWQLSLFAPPRRHAAIDALSEVEPDTLSPREALDLVYELKRLASD